MIYSWHIFNCFYKYVYVFEQTFFITWIEKNDGAETAKLRFIHFHFPHFCHELGKYAIKNCAHAGLVRAASMNVQAGR